MPRVISHLSTAIPVTVPLLRVHLSVEEKRCQSAFYQRHTAPTAEAPRGLPCSASGSAGGCSRQRADLSPGWEIKIPTGIILLKFAVCAPPLPSFTKRYFLPPPGLWAVRLGGWGGDACQPVLFFPPSTVHYTIHPQLSPKTPVNT